MRVISGKYKGKKLIGFDIDGTRPTMDRVKESLFASINGYLDMLFTNYYSKGLNTPELINPKYAASSTWSEKINNYILEIKSK